MFSNGFSLNLERKISRIKNQPFSKIAIVHGQLINVINLACVTRWLTSRGFFMGQLPPVEKWLPWFKNLH